jgi:CDP-diacylglycerol pyrophosphatase
MLGIAPGASADPDAKPVTKFPECPGPPDDLWTKVEGSTPQQKKTNIDVVFPTGEYTHGYALHNGKPSGKNPYDYLLVPTVRETGIECSNLVNSNPTEYFNAAFNYVGNGQFGLPKDTDWALGIESGDPNARSHNQLHIHVSRLRLGTRNSLKTVAASCAPNESQWLKSKIVVETDHGTRTFRCWNASVMTHNFFGKLNDEIVRKLKGVSMSNETLLITANKGGSGYLVLNSDHVGPDLNKNGVNNIEGLLDKGV